MDLGKRLKEARERADLSQEALARRADVSTVAVSQIEQGRTKEPHYHTLHRLSKVLGVSPHWLYTGEELEEPALAGKAVAPGEAGPPDEAPEGKEREIHPVSLSEVREKIEAIKLFEEEREEEIKAVKQGYLPRYFWIDQLQTVNERLMEEAAGIIAYADEAKAGRAMAEEDVYPACLEYERLLSNFVKLTDEAKAAADQRHLQTHVKGKEVVSAAERYAHGEPSEQRG